MGCRLEDAGNPEPPCMYIYTKASFSDGAFPGCISLSDVELFRQFYRLRIIPGPALLTAEHMDQRRAIER